MAEQHQHQPQPQLQLQHHPESRIKRALSLRRFRPHVPRSSLASTSARTDSTAASSSRLRRMTRTPNLGISVQASRTAADATGCSPLSSPRTPHSAGPASPHAFNQTFGEAYDAEPRSPITSLPARVPSPKQQPTKTSKSFFSNTKASRSATKLAKTDSPRPPLANSSHVGAMSQVYGYPRGPSGSSPELSVTDHNSESTFFFKAYLLAYLGL
jgi:hypothetical protein